MRLTIELVEKSTSFTNSLKIRELDLRGNKIPSLENTSATRDAFDFIDFTDNDIRIFENFSCLYKLKYLAISNNLISKIDDETPPQLPNLFYLILSNNKIASLDSIISISKLRNLRHLVLIDNPITKVPNYRLLIIKNFPLLQTLDFEKITQKVGSLLILRKGRNLLQDQHVRLNVNP